MKKTLKKSAAVLLSLIFVCSLCFAFAACKNTKIVDMEFNDNYYTTEYYFGTTDQGSDEAKDIDLEDFTGFDNAAFSISSTNAAYLDGNNLVILSAGEFELTIIADKETIVKNVHILDDAVNAYTAEEAREAVNAEVKVCLMNDIETGDIEDGYDEYFWLRNDFYGNTFLIDASETVYDADTRVFGIYDYEEEEGLVIRDVHISNYDVVDRNNFDLTILVESGIPIVIERSKNISLLNCFIENGHKLVRLSNAEVYVEGCYFRTSSDASFAIGASNDGPSDVTMKNNVFMNAFVCPIIFFCTEKSFKPENYCKLHIQGFLDLYAWVESNDVKIIPSTESYAFLNDTIATYASKKSYDSYYYKENGKKYLHLGMFVICSDKNSENHPYIDYAGKDIKLDSRDQATSDNDLGFVRRDFPMPDVGKAVLTTTEVIGYSYGDFPAHLAVGKTINDNPAIWTELHEGRK